MPIAASCTKCGKAYQLDDSVQGKKVRCKTCAEVFVVSGNAAAPSSLNHAIQTAPRRPVPRPVVEDDDGEEDIRPRFKRQKKNNDQTVAYVFAGVSVGLLVLALLGIGIWWALSSRQAQTPTTVASAPTPPPALPAPIPPPQQTALAPPPNPGLSIPPVQDPPANAGQNAAGESRVELTNAKVSGFGIQLQITVDYKFTSGSPAGKGLYLIIRPSPKSPIHSKMYEAQLHSIGNKTQGTINAGGMTFGIEHGPFEIWMEQGSPRMPGPGFPGMPEPDRKEISNHVTVQTMGFAPPGPMGRPGVPRRPGIPRP